MVGIGVGLAFLPALYVQSGIESRGDISVLDLRDSNLYRQIGLTWRRRSVHAAFYKEIADLIKETAENKLHLS